MGGTQEYAGARDYPEVEILSKERRVMSNGGGRSAGVGLWGFGSMMAITLSCSVNHSILWMIAHGICSWFYVIYYAVEK